MTRYDLVILDDAEAVAREAVGRFAAAYREAVAERPFFAFALAGGSTPTRAYAALAREASIDWSRVHVFWGDERAVPPDDEASNARMAREALLRHVTIPEANVHAMPIDAPDLKTAAARYERTLIEQLGDPPRLDLVFLGLGDDAHTASLFPRAAALAAHERWVVETPAPQIAPRLTLTLSTINAARRVVFLVTGAGKRDALARVWLATGDDPDLPAALVRPLAAPVVWLVDRAAAPAAAPGPRLA